MWPILFTLQWSAMISLHSFFIPAQVPPRSLVLGVMTALFVICLVVANLVGSMLFSFELPFYTPWGNEVLLSSGIILFPVTFILTDLLNEFYGATTARFVTLIGFIMSMVVYGFLKLGLHLPIDERSLLSYDQFGVFSGLYTNMAVASLTAYWVGQLLDIQVFNWFYQLTKNRMIWLRAQGSTLISQWVDSLLVSFIAFSGTLSRETIWQVALSDYAWKFVIVLSITPVLYLGHFVLRHLIKSVRDR